MGGAAVLTPLHHATTHAGQTGDYSEFGKQRISASFLKAEKSGFAGFADREGAGGYRSIMVDDKANAGSRDIRLEDADNTLRPTESHVLPFGCCVNLLAFCSI
jgi:hypothetical protein